MSFYLYINADVAQKNTQRNTILPKSETLLSHSVADVMINI